MSAQRGLSIPEILLFLVLLSAMALGAYFVIGGSGPNPRSEVRGVFRAVQDAHDLVRGHKPSPVGDFRVVSAGLTVSSDRGYAVWVAPTDSGVPKDGRRIVEAGELSEASKLAFVTPSIGDSLVMNRDGSVAGGIDRIELSQNGTTVGRLFVTAAGKISIE